MSGAWIDVNLDAVINNYRQVRDLLQSGTRCMAVVKADGYGLGAVAMAKVLADEGCEAFAVTSIEEGLILRQQGIRELIFVLGPSLQTDLEEAVQAGLHLSVADLSTLSVLEELCLKLKIEANIHLKLETGMGRTGFFIEDLTKLAQTLADAPHVKVTGVYTHFARAGQRDQSYTQAQYHRFQEGVAHLDELGVHPQWQHVCNSAAFLDYPEWHHDFVRIGTLLIGHYPGQGFAQKLTLQDPWSAKAPIVHIRKVPRGTFVGYRSVYRTKKETHLAVIPAGYADGFGIEPHLTPQGLIDLMKIIVKNCLALFGVFFGSEKVVLHGHPVEVAGKIGMQLTVLDVGEVPCRLGDAVEISIRRTTANPRLVRYYWKSGRIFAKRTLEEGFLRLNPEYSSEYTIESGIFSSSQE